MKFQTQDQLEKDNNRLRKTVWAVVAAAFLIVSFIGTMNINTTEAARHYEQKLKETDAKAKYFEKEFIELKQSGTCLERIPSLEALS